ncbi:hypothetical protein IW262DRAFT_1465005 [Armillaria fumosa]|nr:hypothetical protein IW262DRAFT_1465005 [Armillaria fumosa]
MFRCTPHTTPSTDRSPTTCPQSHRPRTFRASSPTSEKEEECPVQWLALPEPGTPLRMPEVLPLLREVLRGSLEPTMELEPNPWRMPGENWSEASDRYLQLRLASPDQIARPSPRRPYGSSILMNPPRPPTPPHWIHQREEEEGCHTTQRRVEEGLTYQGTLDFTTPSEPASPCSTHLHRQLYSPPPILIPLPPTPLNLIDFEEELEVERLLSPTPLEPAYHLPQPRSTTMTQGSMQSSGDDAYESATLSSLATSDEEGLENPCLHTAYDNEKKTQMSPLEIPGVSDALLYERLRAAPSTWGLQIEPGHPSPYPSKWPMGPTGLRPGPSEGQTIYEGEEC